MNCFSLDAIYLDLQEQLGCDFVGSRWAILVGGCPCGKGLAVWKHQGHQEIFVSKTPRGSPTWATRSSKEAAKPARLCLPSLHGLILATGQSVIHKLRQS